MCQTGALEVALVEGPTGELWLKATGSALATLAEQPSGSLTATQSALRSQ